MQKFILKTSLIIPLIGMQIATVAATTLPAVAPTTSSAPVNWIFSQFFENISTAPLATNTNPILIGFNAPTHASPMMPIYLTDSQFISPYLKSLWVFGWDSVLNGFDTNGNPLIGSMDTMVKNFLGSTYTLAPAKYWVRWFDVSGNIITSQNIGYWDAIWLGINYPGWSVAMNWVVRVNGNATTNNATNSNHLVTYGQVQSQITSIKNAIP